MQVGISHISRTGVLSSLSGPWSHNSNLRAQTWFYWQVQANKYMYLLDSFLTSYYHKLSHLKFLWHPITQFYWCAMLCCRSLLHFEAMFVCPCGEYSWVCTLEQLPPMACVCQQGRVEVSNVGGCVCACVWGRGSAMNVILQEQQGDFQLICPNALKGVVPALLQDFTSTYYKH